MARSGEGNGKVDVFDATEVDAATLDAARSGDAGAQGDLAISLMRSGERAEAMPWIRQGAALGEARCQYLLGVALFNGDDVPQDRIRALSLLTEARDAGVAPARDALAALGAEAQASVLSTAPAAASVVQFDRLRERGPASLDVLADALLRPLLRERLDRLLPATIERQVDTALALRTAAPPAAYPVRRADAQPI